MTYKPLNSILLYVKPSSKSFYALLAVVALLVAAAAFIIIVKHDVHKNDR